jgi:hypothetical protein
MREAAEPVVSIDFLSIPESAGRECDSGEQWWQIDEQAIYLRHDETKFVKLVLFYCDMGSL